MYCVIFFYNYLTLSLLHVTDTTLTAISKNEKVLAGMLNVS